MPEQLDVVVVGAGISGIYQLYRLREAGFSVRVLDAAGGVGGTWYWNRYPGARFDSESYTYAYLFSRELYEQWRWTEHFASQPEIERYLNHVVDRFDLRRFIQLNTKVVAADYDEIGGCWTIRTEDGKVIRSTFVVAATGPLSTPYFPDVPGNDSFEGESYHPGRWPLDPVDFDGKRIAVVGTGSSGVQLIPEIVPVAESVTVYQRTANWCTPLNNSPIDDEEWARLKRDYNELCDRVLAQSAGFLHHPIDRSAFDDTAEERRRFFEEMWHSPGFRKLYSNYRDLLTDETANAEWSEFVANKIRGIVHDPTTAELLIPKGHGYGMKRPPMVNGYFEAFNRENVWLVDLRHDPIVRVTPTGIETTNGSRKFDIIVWATGFDFATGALTRLGITGRNQVSLQEHWSDGPRTMLGLQSSGFPNLFFVGGPHAILGNVPRATGRQVDYVTDLLVHLRESGFNVVEPEPHAEAEWMRTIQEVAGSRNVAESNYFIGANIPGKPRRFLFYAGSHVEYQRVAADVAARGYEGFAISRSG